MGAASHPASRIAASAVRAYDIRGEAGEEIDEGGARALGLSYALTARTRQLARIGVGRDGRTSSPRFEAALVEGLVAGGMQVHRLGLCPTPALGFAVRRLHLDGGIMVTASHNPPAENGFKILIGGERVHGEQLKGLVQARGATAPGGEIREAAVTELYLDALVGAAAGMAPLAIAWDSGNGATGPLVKSLTERLPGRHGLLNTTVDGHFPAHHPDPAVAANLDDLASAVRSGRFDLGVAFDGDGDRLGVVDGAGTVVWADEILLLLASDLLRRCPGATVIADVKCSRRLFEGIAALGGRAVVSPSGYVLVRQAMRREGALLAGELSGHIFFDDGWEAIDDALYAAIRTFLAMERLGLSLADFAARLPPTFATPELRMACPEARKCAVVAEVAARVAPEERSFDPALGLRVENADGWWLLRASGTESKLTCRCEADSPEALARLRSRLFDELQRSGVEPQLR